MSTSISVIIPTYNRSRQLICAMNSVLAQTHADFELVVVDDGSDDETAELVSSHDWPISYIRQVNRGVSAARNVGIKAAKYEYLAFLDSDDRFDSDKLKIQLAAMVAAPDYLISHTCELWHRQGRVVNQNKKYARTGGDIFKRSLELCVVGMSTVMVRRELFDRVGLFDESLPCCEDYDLWLRVSCRYPFLLVPEPLTIKNGGRSDQVSAIHRQGMGKFRIASLIKLLESGVLSDKQKIHTCRELALKCMIYGNGCLKHGHEEEANKYLGLARNYQS